MRRFFIAISLWLGLLNPVAAQLTAIGVGGGFGAAAAGSPVTLDACGLQTSAPGSGAIAYTNLTVGGGLTNGILVTNIVMGTNTATPTGMTAVWDLIGANQAMTAVPGSPATNGNQSIFSFYLLNPTAGNKVLTVTWTGGGTMSAVACSYQGATGVANFNSSTGGTPQQVTITAGANDAVFGAFSSVTNFTSTGVTQIDIDNGAAQWALAWQRTTGPNPTLQGNPGNATSLSAGFAITP